MAVKGLVKMTSLIFKVVRKVEMVVIGYIGNEVLTSMHIAVTTGTEYPIGVLRIGMSAGQPKRTSLKTY